MARPPSFIGARHVIVAAEAVVTTRSMIGAFGAVGMEYGDVAEIDEPMAFSADTDTENAAFDERPSIEHVRTNGLAGTHVPIELVTAYDWIAVPPSAAGEDQETCTELGDVASI